MKPFFRLFIFLSLVLMFSPSAEASPRRIVSLTPVGTEILFALGQGDNVIGVTNYCDYPPEALKKPKIGGYAEVNFETLLSKKADLLVLQDMHLQFKDDLKRLKIPYVVVRQESLGDIYDSIAELGKVCGAQKRAAELTAKMKADIAAVRAKVMGLPSPSVLLCVSRELSEERISVFYAAGEKTFYNELITLAGGKNALTGEKSGYPYPKISQEGLAALNPEVIIDLVGERTFYHAMEHIDLDKVFNEEYLKGQWLAGTKVRAVRGGRIAVLDGTVYLRPGPRLPEILRAFAKVIHPEVKW
ncbi:ABC transporter substrate-binding protein [Cloacibacillus porcorum]|uniref:Uncharacterized protein n=1 Tax=Cloacibacillus porcorum TaxID=1197717 RepID=A0A1B2I7T4_9BACT|nr:ABC transporter substrate-binding protein [Cloacibacillus porcorum]ANZ46029.1 hypothetical protein BED41_13555 [Cloacibacillus porcorum]MCC8183179.1 ABC transporter substrate-binding protein [Cloacibacillus porcorum]MDY5389782.1 ABC transporter substrate-binding protein [Cloacibacillus porcorum]NMF17537.1 ABC transporter substrate-binding protein [Cloacibacillus porcorum]